MRVGARFSRSRLGFQGLLFLVMGAAMAHPLLSRLPPDTLARPLAFSDLPNWAGDDHAAAFETFLATCAPLLDGAAALRDALPPGAELTQACKVARSTDKAQARVFFEQNFTPFDIRSKGGDGFLTAYYEPELEASPEKTAAFPVPALGRPADLVTLKQGETRPGLDPALQAARQGEKGLEPYPDRAAIWAGALEGKGLEVVWLRDHAELFITQVQGSARLKLPGGRVSRLVYAGRNGHPYTSVGRKIVERGDMTLEEMTLAKLMAYLRADVARGRALMELNRSYVFFARDDSLDPAKGPIGGAGVPLSPQRSLAVDRTLWPYGLPVYIDVNPLTPAGPRARIQQLMVAQDTGSAIVGPARADFFMGSGAEAGERAGLVRDPLRFIVLLPKA
jgi:membrane-bound lytic murein transglycosylase A